MFKKSLLALGVVAFSATASASSLVTYPTAGTSDAAPTVSTQGFAKLAAAAKTISPEAALTISSSGDVANVNKAVITLTGASFNDAAATFKVISGGEVHKTLTPSYTFGDTSTVTLSGFSSGDALANGQSISIAGATYKLSGSATGDKATMSIALQTALEAVDSATATLATFVDQFSVATEKFGTSGEKIDVQQDAKQLVGGVSDTFSIKVTSTSADYHKITTAASLAVALGGDFSWALNASGTESGASLTEGSYTITSSAQKLAVNFDPTANGGSTAYPLTVTPLKSNGTGTLTTGAYTADLTLSQGTTTLLSKEALALGSWELNGSDVSIAYMPFGSNYAQAISVTNTGSFSGDIMVSFTANGTTTDLVSVGTSTGKSVVNVGKEVNKAADAAGITEAQVNIVVKAPSNDIKVTAIYYAKADADRVKVN